MKMLSYKVNLDVYNNDDSLVPRLDSLKNVLLADKT